MHSLRAALEASRSSETARQFWRFALVGTLGFVVDGGLTQLAVSPLGFSPFWARIPAFVVAVHVTWALNRAFTFGASAASHPYARSFPPYLSGNVAGIAINLGVYYAALALSPALEEKPFFAVAAGSIAAMFVNFAISRLWVFGKQDK